MKNGYYIDFAQKTISITKAFNKRANEIGSMECDTMTKLISDYPGFRLMYKPTSKRPRHGTAALTYAKMENYLRCLPDASRLINEFSQVRKLALSQESKHAFVKDWFLEKFPDYDAIPQFDDEGNLMVNEYRNNVLEFSEQNKTA